MLNLIIISYQFHFHFFQFLFFYLIAKYGYIYEKLDTLVNKVYLKLYRIVLYCILIIFVFFLVLFEPRNFIIYSLELRWYISRSKKFSRERIQQSYLHTPRKFLSRCTSTSHATSIKQMHRIYERFYLSVKIDDPCRDMDTRM